MRMLLVLLALLIALAMTGCATVKEEGIRNLRSIIPVIPDAPTYREGTKLYV